MATARDKFWIFGVRPHQDDIWLGKQREGRKFYRSRITPAEGAFLLNVPNMLLVNCDGIPVPFSEDAAGYAESFRPLKKVLWGGKGSGGFRIGNEEKYICKLCEEYPNIAGEFLDDIFGDYAKSPNRVEESAALLSEIRGELDKAPRPMELYVTWYTHEMWAAVPEISRYLDGISIWNWHCEDIPKLAETFAAAEQAFPQHKKLLGIYMYDFPSGMPVPSDLMEYQCNFGLKMLEEGRLDGMVFEANSVMGVGLSSEKWLTEWIDQVKDRVVPD